MEMIKEKKEKKIFIKKKNRSLINISVNSLENVPCFFSIIRGNEKYFTVP